MLRISGGKRRSFSTQEVGRKKKLARCFKKWESYISVLKKKKKHNDRIFSLAWNIVYWLLKKNCFEFFGNKKYVLFWAKKWWKFDTYWLLKGFCFELFGNGKYVLFWGQKVGGKMIFTDYWKVLVLNFSGMRNTVFFEAKSW